jgi:hypothetical protein
MLAAWVTRMDFVSAAALIAPVDEVMYLLSVNLPLSARAV